MTHCMTAVERNLGLIMELFKTIFAFVGQNHEKRA